MTDRLDAMEARLHRAEKLNRRLFWLLLSLPVVALILGAQGQQAALQGKRVVAQEFVLTDADGKTRATLMALKDGAHLVLQDSDGKARVRLAANAENAGPLLFLYTKNERVAWAAGQNKDNGIGFVEFFNDGEWKGGVGGSAFKK